MIHTLKRLGAILMAAALLFGILGAPTQASAEELMAAYARGAKIKTETAVDFNEDTIRSLANMIAPGMLGEEGSMQSKMLGTVLSAVRKLKFTAIGDQQTAYVNIGTDQGELFNVYASIAAEDSFVLTSLLPGLELKLPAEMLNVQVVKPEDVQEIVKSLTAYGMAAGEFVMQNLLPAVQSEEGSFEFDGTAYDKKTTLELKSHQLAGMLEKLLDVFKKDDKLQQKLDETLKTVAAAQKLEGEAAKVPTSQDFITEIEKGVADIKNKADEKVSNVTVYTLSGSENVRVETELLNGSRPEALVTVDVLGKESNETVRISILTGNTADEGAEMVDWAAFRQGIMSGERPDGVLLSLEVSGAADDAAGTEATTAMFDLRAMGMKLGVEVKSDMKTGDRYLSDTRALVSVMDLPLVTFTTRSGETDEKIPMLYRDGLQKITMNENMTEEDTAAVQAALNEALPELVQKLQKALPEEGPLLMSLIQSLSAPGMTEAN